MSAGTQAREALGAVRFRFDDVVIEPQGRRVFVGARERNASRRAFDVLHLLCEQPGRLLTRDELSERLWPGGQVVSDEALTQAIFRARAVLGSHGERIVTVRGVGFRFDAPVRRETVDRADEAAANASAVAASEVSTAATAARARPFPRPVFAALATLIVILLALLPWRWPRAPTGEVDSGYAIAAADVHGEQAGSARLLAEALGHDNRGDRARGRALLEALHDSDARSPWPALLLGLWSVGAGDMRSADDWFARAQERAAPLRDVFVNAMMRYAQAERGGAAADIIRYAGAVLDLRAGAWRMHLARAHLMHSQGQRDAALAEISRIEIHELGNRKLEAALADRASFGDVAGAQAVLDGLPRANDAAAWEYLAGRIAWSRGDAAAARAAWERAATEAQRGGRADIGNRALANAGLAAMLGGDRAGAIAHFERARVGMTAAGWVNDEIDLSLLLAQLRALDGKADMARAEFDRATAAGLRGGDALLRAQIALVGARAFPAAVPAPIESLPAAQALLGARLAHVRGDDAQARQEFDSALQRGVLDIPIADEARLLAAELDLAVPPEHAFDPPYPPLSAAAARLFPPLANR